MDKAKLDLSFIKHKKNMFQQHQLLYFVSFSFQLFLQIHILLWLPYKLIH